MGKSAVELIDGETKYFAKPMAPHENAESEQTGTIQKFRVTTTDGLNHIFGIVSWPAAQPEIISVERISGLEKYKKFEKGGRVSIVETNDGKWLAELKVLKYGNKDYPTPHTSNWTELDYILGGNAQEALLFSGALAVGSRALIDGETNKNRFNLAVKVRVRDYQALAVAYALTKVLSVMHDLGLSDEY